MQARRVLFERVPRTQEGIVGGITAVLNARIKKVSFDEAELRNWVEQILWPQLSRHKPHKGAMCYKKFNVLKQVTIESYTKRFIHFLRCKNHE